MTKPWDAYERISDDSTDTQEGVGRQREDTEKAVAARGGHVETHHAENNTSAYKKRRVALVDPQGNAYEGYRVVRPVWSEALRRLRSGEASRLMVWDLDRLARDPRDLEDAIEVVEHFGAEIRSATAGDIDLSTETGRMNARLLVLMANKASADTSRRVARKKEANRAEGKRQGGRYRTYGYTRDWQVVDSEAAIVKEAFERRAKGESITAIAKDFTSRGETNVNGKPWNAGNLGKVLEKPDYAGLISYKGEIVGKASFKAIVSEALFTAVSKELASSSRRGQNARAHLLTGFLVCSTCLTGMKGNIASNHYRCPSPADVPSACGSRTAKLDKCDELLFNAAWAKAQAKPVVKEEPTRDFETELTAIDAKISELRAAHDAGNLELEDLTPMLKFQREQRNAVVAAQAEATVGDMGILQILSDWETMNLSQRRLWLARYLKHVLVHPPTRNNRLGFDCTRLEVFYTDGTSARLAESRVVDSLNV